MNTIFKVKQILETNKRINVLDNRRSFVWNSEIFLYAFKDLMLGNSKSLYLGNVSFVNKKNYVIDQDKIGGDKSNLEYVLENSILNDGLQRITSVQIMLLAIKNVASILAKDNAAYKFVEKLNINIPFMKSNGNDNITFINMVKDANAITIENELLINHEIVNCYTSIYKLIIDLVKKNDVKYFETFLNNILDIEFNFVDFTSDISGSSLHRIHNMYVNEDDYLSQFSSFLRDIISQSYGSLKEFYNESLEIKFKSLNFNVAPFNIKIEYRNQFARSFFLELLDKSRLLNTTSNFTLFTEVVDLITTIVSNMDATHLHFFIEKIGSEVLQSFDFFKLVNNYDETDSFFGKTYISRQQHSDDKADGEIDITQLIFPIKYIISDFKVDYSESFSIFQMVYKLWLNHNIFTDDFLCFIQIMNISLLRNTLLNKQIKTNFHYIAFVNWLNSQITFEDRVLRKHNLNLHFTFIKNVVKYVDDVFLWLSTSTSNKDPKDVDVASKSLIEGIIKNDLNSKYLRIILITNELNYLTSNPVKLMKQLSDLDSKSEKWIDTKNNGVIIKQYFIDNDGNISKLLQYGEASINMITEMILINKIEIYEKINSDFGKVIQNGW